jgi:hypothetical protein
MKRNYKLIYSQIEKQRPWILSIFEDNQFFQSRKFDDGQQAQMFGVSWEIHGDPLY